MSQEVVDHDWGLSSPIAVTRRTLEEIIYNNFPPSDLSPSNAIAKIRNVGQVIYFLDNLLIADINQLCNELKWLSIPHYAWKNILHQICKEDGLFLPSYPDKNMNFTHYKLASIAREEFLEMTQNNERPERLKSSGQLFFKFGPVSV